MRRPASPSPCPGGRSRSVSASPRRSVCSSGCTPPSRRRVWIQSRRSDMSDTPLAALLWLAAAVVLIVAVYRARRRRRRGTLGAAAAGSVYDWLNEDKRNAVEIIVEERAAARDPEDKDGNLPDLAG